MKLTLVLLFLGLSFISGEYKFPDLNENEIKEGEKIIYDKFDDFKSKSHDKYLLNPFFEDLRDILNIIQKRNSDFLKKAISIVSHVNKIFYDQNTDEPDVIGSIEEAQKEFHGLASVQYFSLSVVAEWAARRLETININTFKDLNTIDGLLFDVQFYCQTAATNLANTAEQTFNKFEDMKNNFLAGNKVEVITYLDQNFALKTQEAIVATNKLIQKSTPTLTQIIKECLTCGSTKVVE